MLIDLQLPHKSDITQECHTRWIWSHGWHCFLFVIVLYALRLFTVCILSRLHPSENGVMTWVQYCVIEIDDLFYYLCFVCMCMCAYTPRMLREHIVTLVVFGHQRPCWQRLKWWLRTGGLDGKMWINEAQIELIAMTSHNSGAAKWEYVVGPPESQRLFCFQGDGWSISKEKLHLSTEWPYFLALDYKRNKNKVAHKQRICFWWSQSSTLRKYIYIGLFSSA